MNEILNIILPLTNEEITRDLARVFAASLKSNALENNTLENNLVIYLQGDLGTGKTTFTRYLLNSLGHAGKVKSPTYTLIEHYEISDLNIYHLDLYRLAEAQELSFIGLDDYLAANNAVFLIEWPDKGENYLPKPDLKLSFVNAANDRKVELAVHTNNKTTLSLWKELEKKLTGGF